MTMTGNLVHVEFNWSDEHGTCEDCGRPAAYEVEDGANFNFKACSVCAAGHAADGAELHRLFEED